MSDDIVVVDNGQTYETSESAIVAKNEADRAEQWAKYSEEKANLADERAIDAAESSDAAAQAATAAIEAKQYAEEAITDNNLITVATDLKATPSNIKIVATNIDDVNSVADNITNVNAVADNETNINAVNANKANIDTVATNIDDVVMAAGIKDDIVIVSENISDVMTVADNIADVNNVANNMTDVKAAVSSAESALASKNSAAQSETNAQIWAEGEDPQVTGLGGTHSAKKWAELAGSLVNVQPASETTSGIVRLSTTAEAKEGFDDSTAITPLKLAQVISDNVGRGIQLGFNGTLEGNLLTFETTDPSPYTLRHNYDYEIDLLFQAVGILPDDVEVVIKNGSDYINIVNVLHDDPTTHITVGDIRQIMKYNDVTGWHWVFMARYAITASGNKVFVMPSTVVDISDELKKIKTGFSIFDIKYSDHIIDDVMWLRGDTFSWHNGASYSLAYNELLNEYNSVQPGKGFGRVGYAWKKSDGTIKYTRSETPMAFSTEMNGNCMLFIDGSCINAGRPVTYISSVGSGTVTDGSGNTWTRDSSSDVAAYLKWTPVNLTEYKYSSNNYVTDGATVWKGKGNYDKTSETDIFDDTKLTYWKTNTSYTAAVLAEYGTATGNTYTGYTVEIFSSTQTETIGDTTITFVRTPKGYKIVDATQEQNVIDIYNNTGVAWYYILDTTNTRFKLPRSKYNFVGLRDNVGSYVPESLPDHWHAQGLSYKSPDNGETKYGVVDGGATSTVWDSGIGNTSTISIKTSPASLFFDAYQDGAPVQQRATQMYLYFYVGNFSKTATEQTAGLNAELFNGKADRDLNNLSSTGKQTVTSLMMADYDNPIYINSNGVNGVLDYDAKVTIMASITYNQDYHFKIVDDEGNYIDGIRAMSKQDNYAATLSSYFPKGSKYMVDFSGTIGGVAGVYIYKLKGGI